MKKIELYYFIGKEQVMDVNVEVIFEHRIAIIVILYSNHLSKTYMNGKGK